MNSMTVSVTYDVIMLAIMVIAFYSAIAGYPLTDDTNVKTQFDPLIDITESELLNVVCELPTLST